MAPSSEVAGSGGGARADFSGGLVCYKLLWQTPLKASLLLPKHGFNTLINDI